jgi:phospholipid/cholesterol/gamma-HCH transport system permease protein
MPLSPKPADIVQPISGCYVLSGHWTARAVGNVDRKLAAMDAPDATEVVIDGANLDAIDSVGVWILQRHLQILRDRGVSIRLREWSSQARKLMEVVEAQIASPLLQSPRTPLLELIGRKGAAVWKDSLTLFSFLGETALAVVHTTPHPGRWRIRTVLNNIQRAGFDALPIVGLTSLLLGIVVAYQGADQLRHYGANIFVVDLVGFSMLREFSPLITAIIIAGRSGSAYAAQIGTMVVTEEIDAMRTIGIEPIDLLVVPKIIALVIALPLLTVFADVTGVLGGMIMARSQLDIGFTEFLGRFGTAMHVSTLLIGIGKAFVFAFIIVLIGCYQGFQTKGNADSVGRQTTRSVVQSIFIVIILDAIFSIVFSTLGL